MYSDDVISFLELQGGSQEGKKFFILHELGNTTHPRVWAHCQPLSGISGDQDTKPLKNLESLA